MSLIMWTRKSGKTIAVGFQDETYRNRLYQYIQNMKNVEEPRKEEELGFGLFD